MAEIIKAREMSPESARIVVVMGPPGLGKSWFAGSVADLDSIEPEEVLVIATLAREAKSDLYQKHNVDVALIEDPDWIPEKRKFLAKGYDELMELLESLAEDEQYKAVVLDSGTEAAELAWNSSLSPHGVGKPADLPGKKRWLPYDTLDGKLSRLVAQLTLLTDPQKAALEKHVIITWHTQPQKEGLGDDESADEAGEGVEYVGKVLPMVRGRFRRRLAAKVDIMMYADRVQQTDPKTLKSEWKYVMQIQPDASRHTKFPGVVPADLKYIPNNFSAMMETIGKTTML